MSSTKISVVMPTFNGAKNIEETLRSIFTQTVEIDQLICSDDKSSDETVSIIKSFANKTLTELVVVSHIPNGVTANYLNTLKYVTGDLVLVADQDDIWVADKVECVVKAFNASSVALVCHDSQLVNHELSDLGKTVRGSARRSRALTRKFDRANDERNLEIFLSGGTPLLAHTLAFRSSLIPILLQKPADINQWWFEEWLSCVALTSGRLKLIDRSLVAYRQHSGQTSGGFSNRELQSSLNVNPVGKYHNRIQKISYCAQICATQGVVSEPFRYRVLSDYVEFLEARQTILMDKGLRSVLMGSIKLLLLGRYHRYAKGFFSFGMDFLVSVRGSK